MRIVRGMVRPHAPAATLDARLAAGADLYFGFRYAG
jgi:hypothetical protein